MATLSGNGMGWRLTERLREPSSDCVYDDTRSAVMAERSEAWICSKEFLSNNHNQAQHTSDRAEEPHTSEMALPKCRSGWFRISSAYLLGSTIFGPVSVKT